MTVETMGFPVLQELKEREAYKGFPVTMGRVARMVLRELQVLPVPRVTPAIRDFRAYQELPEVKG